MKKNYVFKQEVEKTENGLVWSMPQEKVGRKFQTIDETFKKWIHKKYPNITNHVDRCIIRMKVQMERMKNPEFECKMTMTEAKGKIVYTLTCREINKRSIHGII
jgi:hypothetical protein